MNNKTNPDDVLKMVLETGLCVDIPYRIIRLFGDGSDRLFFRVVTEKRTVLAVFPSVSHPRAREEAKSCWQIALHLKGLDIPVPDVLFYDHRHGIIIYEDLGDILLHSLVNTQGKTEDAANLEAYYQQAIELLVNFQLLGKNGFCADFCWESSRYDKAIMLERESGYFVDEFCRYYKKIKVVDKRLTNEFQRLADIVSLQPADYLMHRDFQSRNIMVLNGKLRIIDFQGARFGPLGYDLASLLNDPYVDLPYSLRQSLLNYYLIEVEKKISLDPQAFIEGYYHISLQRNLQILGAFAFLFQRRGKIFFKKYMRPALADLHYKLNGPLLGQYPVLSELADTFLM